MQSTASCRLTIYTRSAASTSTTRSSHHVVTGSHSSIREPLLGHLQQHRLRLPTRRLSSAPAAKWIRLDQATHGRSGIRREMRACSDEWDRSLVCRWRRDQFIGARLQRHAVVRLCSGNLEHLRSPDIGHTKSSRPRRGVSQFELVDISLCRLPRRLVPTLICDVYHLSSATLYSERILFRCSASNVTNPPTVQLESRPVHRGKHYESGGVVV